MLACNIPIPGWESLAKDRVAWRQETQNGITAFEVKRLQDLDAKRSIRKERAHNLSSALPARCVVAPVPTSSGCVCTLDVTEGHHRTAMLSNDCLDPVLDKLLKI